MLTKGPAQGRPARAARSVGPDGQDHRQLSRRLHAGASHQRRRPHEHARHRRCGCCSRPTTGWPTKRGRWPSSSKPRTQRRQPEERDILAEAKQDSSRPTPTSAPAPCWSSRAKAGTAASSASSRRSWSTRFIGRRSCCRHRRRRGARLVPQHPGVRHARRRSRRCAPLLERFGGHQGGGGPDDRAVADQGVPRGDRRLGRRAARARRPAPAPADRRALGFRQITPRLMDGLTRLAPFGVGNPRPTFWTAGARWPTARGGSRNAT